jgi:hypothetical protein
VYVAKLADLLCRLGLRSQAIIVNNVLHVLGVRVRNVMSCVQSLLDLFASKQFRTCSCLSNAVQFSSLF